MARKETITIQTILDTAFAMTREEGFANVTARKLACKAGCSTQPIFRVYKNMEELWDAVYDKAVSFFDDYYSLYPKIGRFPFSNLAMCYLSFAREEKYLFELLFATQGIHTKSIYEILNGKTGKVVHEISLARMSGCDDPEELFMKMWIWVHGAACMTLTGNYQWSDKETMELIERSYHAFKGKRIG